MGLGWKVFFSRGQQFKSPPSSGYVPRLRKVREELAVPKHDGLTPTQVAVLESLPGWKEFCKIDFDNVCEFGCGISSPSPVTVLLHCPSCENELAQLCADCAKDDMKTDPDAWSNHKPDCPHCR